MLQPLKALLRDGEDLDVACYHLARCLGIIPWDSFFGGEHKWMFATNNPIGNALYEILEKLIDTGILSKQNHKITWRGADEEISSP